MRHRILSMESELDIALHIFTVCLLLGAVVGFLAGLLGIGGGLVIVPVLLVLLPTAGVAPQILMPIVLGTSLAAILLTSISTLFAHRSSGNFPSQMMPLILSGVGTGALIGSYFADAIPSDVLKLFFACFVILMSAQMWLGSKAVDGCQHGHPSYSSSGLSCVSLFIGGVSSLLGIGGGVLLVPYLTMVTKLNMHRAVATSAVSGLVVASMGSLGYLWAGMHTSVTLPTWSLGYIYLPAFFGIIAISLFTAPIGVKVAKKLPVKTLKRCFAVLLFIVGTKILIG